MQAHAWYALRRTLPPWRFEENLQELVECLPRYGVDELIVKVDTEEFTHGQPPLAWVRAYQENLLRIKEAVERLGIRYSLNPWITLGHNDRGRDARQALPGLQTMVGHDGTQCTCCACPLCQVWRANTVQVWTLYAETTPHVMWVEDDIRTFNHSPVRFGCFCPLHMARFAARIGEPVPRKELVRAMLKPGKPHPWRSAYLDMQAEIMADTVAFLARTVHQVSPGTSLGLMSSGPRTHCLEGRRWEAFALALADGQPLYSRPPLGNYHEDSLRGLYYAHDSIKLTRHCMPGGAVEQTEVENVPFTRYSKSTTFTLLQMALSFAYGSHGVTLNLYDHCGTPMEQDPAFGAMLGRAKPFLEGLARRAQQPGHYRGVGLLHHEQASHHKRLPEHAAYGDMVADGACTMYMLESHGIPTTYERSSVRATSGQLLRAFADGEIRHMLSEGLLLDAVAAHVLYERGFGDLIGLESIAEPACIDEIGTFSAEEFFNERFGGADKAFLTLTLPDLAGRPRFSVLEPVKRAEVISRIVDPDAEHHHVCMYAYKNRLGGHVVVHALDLASAYGVSFCHPLRAVQLQSAVRWLARGHVPILVRGGVHPLAFRKDLGPDLEGQTMLGLLNLALDPWPLVEFELADGRAIAGLERLSPSGRWEADCHLSARKMKEQAIVRYERPVPHDAPLIVAVHWKEDRASSS